MTASTSFGEIPLVQIESKTAQINNVLEYDLSERLGKNFGIVILEIDIGAIEIDKSNKGYEQLMAVTKDITTITVKAETEAKIKDIAAKQRIEAEHYEEALRIQRDEGQYAQHKQTQSANIGAFQVEKHAEVGIAGANALGQMGANGAGNINLSSGEGTGFNMAAMMASMTVGGVVGQNIAGSMNNIMSEISQPVQGGMMPPPIPTITYYVAINGKASGPYDLNTLKQMIIVGQIVSDSLLWKNGMDKWEKAENINDIKTLFNDIPPIPLKE